MMIGIISILFTVFFGIPSIIILFKHYSRKLIFFEEDLINLQDKLAKNIPELEISYKGKKISDHLFLLKGFIFCKGRNDILKDEIEKTLYIELPEKSIWHDNKIITTSKDLKVFLKPNNNLLYFDFGLFKNEEFIYFEGLFESSKPKSIKKQIELHHRIANIGKVVRLNVSDYRNHIRNIFYPLGAAIFFSLSYFLFVPIAKNDLAPIYTIDGIDINFEDIFDTSTPFNYLFEADSLTIDSVKKYEEKISTYLSENTKAFELRNEMYYFRDIAAKEYNLLDLAFNKDTKSYNFKREATTVRFHLNNKFTIYTVLIITSFIFILLVISFAFLLDHINMRKIIKQIDSQINKYRNHNNSPNT